MKFLIRQGDVFIEEVKEIPVDRILRPVESMVLAEGEATGHKHTLIIEDTPRYKGTDINGLMASTGANGETFIRIIGEDGAVLKHQEHLPVTIPPGTYRAYLQREYDPKQKQRNVVD